MTGYPWLKLWNEAFDDAKFDAAADMAGSSVPVATFAFFKACTQANQSADRGSFAGLHLQVIASRCKVPIDEIRRLFQAFRELRMIIGDRIANWAKRQTEKITKPRSAAAERQARHRAKVAAAAAQGTFDLGVTPVTPAPEALQTSVTSAAEEDEEEEFNSEAKASAAEAAPAIEIDPVKILWNRGLVLLRGAHIPEARARRLIGQWRNEFGDAAVMAAIVACEHEAASEPVSFIVGCLRNSWKGMNCRHGRLTPANERFIAGREATFRAVLDAEDRERAANARY